jgi:hypothetical protein
MSDYLFSRPSFLSGAARVLDLGGTFDLYNESGTIHLADTRALFSDWLSVGNGLRQSYHLVTGKPLEPTSVETVAEELAKA